MNKKYGNNVETLLSIVTNLIIKDLQSGAGVTADVNVRPAGFRPQTGLHHGASPRTVQEDIILQRVRGGVGGELEIPPGFLQTGPAGVEEGGVPGLTQPEDVLLAEPPGVPGAVLHLAEAHSARVVVEAGGIYQKTLHLTLILTSSSSY